MKRDQGVGLRKSGFCSTEAVVEGGTIRSTTAPEGWHALCRDPECRCPNHSGEEICSACGAISGEIGLDGRCEDQQECAATLRRALAAQQRLAGIRESSSAKKRAPRAAGKPKSGVCEHCGGATGGGRFQPGHDAKLKGELIKPVREFRRTDKGGPEIVHAIVELRMRGWLPADLDESDSPKQSRLWVMASRVYDAEGQSWLNERNLVRARRTA